MFSQAATRARSWKKRRNWVSRSLMSSNSERCYNRSSMKSLLAGLVLVVTLSGLLTAQRSQQPQRGQRPSAQPAQPAQPEAPPKPVDDQTLSVNVDLVNILFTVADRKGKFVTNL